MAKLTDTHDIAITLEEARWLRDGENDDLSSLIKDAASSAIDQIEGNSDEPEIAITITVYPTDEAYEEA